MFKMSFLCVIAARDSFKVSTRIHDARLGQILVAVSCQYRIFRSSILCKLNLLVLTLGHLKRISL